MGFRISIFMLWVVFTLLSPAYAQKISSPSRAGDLSPQEVIQDLAQANVVYLGETHDSAEDHKAQLYIIQQLYEKDPRMAIGMEMFQRPYQLVLDNYLQGKLTEAALQKQSQYKKRWGYPWENYAPILQFAKEKKLPVLALNTPSEVTTKVSRKGLRSLKAADTKFIPPISQIRTDNLKYRESLEEVYKDVHEKGKAKDPSQFARFFQAQVLWDETMAEVIAQFLKRNPGFYVVVLAGQGHIVYGYGIPSRVARRINSISIKTVVQRSVLLNPTEETPQEKSDIANYFWNNR
ncbi:MAG: ChaN family lipoprotein [Gloeobacterales cyanobacterium]